MAAKTESNTTAPEQLSQKNRWKEFEEGNKILKDLTKILLPCSNLASSYVLAENLSIHLVITATTLPVYNPPATISTKPIQNQIITLSRLNHHFKDRMQKLKDSLLAHPLHQRLIKLNIPTYDGAIKCFRKTLETMELIPKHQAETAFQPSTKQALEGLKKAYADLGAVLDEHVPGIVKEPGVFVDVLKACAADGMDIGLGGAYAEKVREMMGMGGDGSGI